MNVFSKKESTDILSHWYAISESIQFSGEQFYESVEGDLAARGFVTVKFLASDDSAPLAENPPDERKTQIQPGPLGNLPDFDAFVLNLPILGEWYERIRRNHYYRYDSRMLYHTIVFDVVKRKVNELTAAKGVVLLRTYEYSPILGELYKRGSVSATVEPLRDLKAIGRIKAVLSGKPRDFTLFLVGIHVGLRATDLLSLRWCDFCDEDWKVRPRLTVRERKTGITRTIALQPKVRTALDAWRKETGTPMDMESLVWPGPGGRPLSVQRLHQLVNSWCKGADVSGHFGTHTLRKTYGYHLRRAGVAIELIMKAFSHSSAAITQRYIAIEQEEIDLANLKLSL